MRKVLGTIAAALSIASVVTACSGDLGPLEPTVTASRNVITCGGGDLLSVGLAMPNAGTLGASSATNNGGRPARALDLGSSMACCGGPSQYQSPMSLGGGVSLSPDGPQAYASTGGCYDYCYMDGYTEGDGCNGEECRDGGWIGQLHCDPDDCRNHVGGCSDDGGNGGGGGGGGGGEPFYPSEVNGVADGTVFGGGTNPEANSYPKFCPDYVGPFTSIVGGAPPVVPVASTFYYRGLTRLDGGPGTVQAAGPWNKHSDGDMIMYQGEWLPTAWYKPTFASMTANNPALSGVTWAYIPMMGRGVLHICKAWKEVRNGVEMELGRIIYANKVDLWFSRGIQ